MFLFIDGGAELFFEYGFRQALAAEYRNAAGASINLEIYEMSDAGASYGIYSVRAGEEAVATNIGQGGSAQSYYIMFWKGPYYVSVASSDSTADCRRGCDVIARAVDRSIAAEGREPDVVRVLPGANLLRAGYFRGPLGLTSSRALNVEAAFRMVDGAFGSYADHTVVVLRYASEAEARNQLASICEDLRQSGRFRNYRDQGGFVSVTGKENRIFCFGWSGKGVIVSSSLKKSIALASCKEAVMLLSAR